MQAGAGATGTKTATAGDAGVNIGQLVALKADTNPPTVSTVSSAKANGSYFTGEVFDIQVVFSEVVIVNTGGGSPTLTLETGATDRAAALISGSGSATLVFRYTVQEGDGSSDLDYTTTTALALNGGIIQDGDSNNAALTLPSPAAAGSLGANKALVINPLTPFLLGIVVNQATLTFSFSEILDAGSTPATGDFVITLSVGTATVTTVGVAGTTVTLTLASAVAFAETVSVSYTAGGNPIRSSPGSLNAANFANQAAINSTASPEFAAPPSLPSEPEEPEEPDDGAADLSGETTITPEGDGEATVQAGTITLSLTPAAVDQPLTLALEQTASSPAGGGSVAETLLPAGVSSILADAALVTVSDPAGAAAPFEVRFDEDLVISFTVPPDTLADTPAEEITVALWDAATATWIPLRTSVTPLAVAQTPSDGSPLQVSGRIARLRSGTTEIRLLQVPSVTQVLRDGLNLVTFTGPADTPTAEIAAAFGSALESIWHFDVASESWRVFAPANPSAVNTLTTLDHRAVLFLRLRSEVFIAWRTGGLIATPSGEREVILQQGLNVVPFTGPSGTAVAELFGPTVIEPGALAGVFAFDSQTQRWRTFHPELPPLFAHRNSLGSLERLTPLFIQSRAATPIPVTLPETQESGAAGCPSEPGIEIGLAIPPRAFPIQTACA